MIHEIYPQSQDSPKTSFPKFHPPGTKLLQRDAIYIRTDWVVFQ